MTNGPGSDAPLSIAELSPTTVRQIGLSQVLIDPSSVIKELIDNALDARANAIFIDVSANTIDSIQVKDTGHGIPPEDRPLVCRQYCTSKIRDFHDLKSIGGKWLGFRGEAMASMADMSGMLEVTTRVEGESVAVKVKYGRDGELVSTGYASAPVGTIVKVADLFKFLPVRKQTALRHSNNWLAKIRRLVQAYALARPTVRFNLHVLKAKSNKCDFLYAPKKVADVEDVVFKVIGKDCASQCEWATLESDGFTIRASLPKRGAIGSKIANEGAFISVDGRPVSRNRGTPKKIVRALQERLYKADPIMRSVKDPFFCMNIICPPQSYDPNIEPAKDNVLFDNSGQVIGAVEKLLLSFYPRTVLNTRIDEELDPSTSAQRPPHSSEGNLAGTSQTSSLIQDGSSSHIDYTQSISSPKELPQWKSNMYGIDEEDLELISRDQELVMEEEEGRRAAEISNPWTITRMNASIKEKRAIDTRRPISLTKSHNDGTTRSSFPTLAITPRKQLPTELLTPQSSSRQNMISIVPTDKPEQIVKQLHKPDNKSIKEHLPIEGIVLSEYSDGYPEPPLPVTNPMISSPAAFLEPSAQASARNESYSLARMQVNAPGLPLNMIPSSPSFSPRRSHRKGKFQTSIQNSSEAAKPNDYWFGRLMNGHARPKQRDQKKSKQTHSPETLLLPINRSPNSRVILGIEDKLYSENAVDIRDFFRPANAQHRKGGSAMQRLTPTPITPTSASRQRFQANQAYCFDNRDCIGSRSSQIGSLSQPISRASSVEPHSRLRQTLSPSLTLSNFGPSFDPLEPTAKLSRQIRSEDSYNSRPRAASAEPFYHYNIVPKIPATSVAAYSRTRPTMSERSKKSLDMLGLDVAKSLVRNDDAIIRSQEYIEREDSAKNKPNSPLHSHGSSYNSMGYEKAINSYLVRGLRIDVTQQVKSFKSLPERVLQGYRIHDIVISVDVSLEVISKRTRKMHIHLNSLEREQSARETQHSIFNTPVTNSIVRAWTLQVVRMLGYSNRRQKAIEIVENGICKALHDRNVTTRDTSIEKQTVSGDNDTNTGLDDFPFVEAWTKQVIAARATKQNDTDTSEIVLRKLSNEYAKDESDEFKQGVENDEILLDF